MNLSLNPLLDKLINLKIKKVENILVIRQHNQLGDMLCSLTLYAALKKKFPDSRITLVAAKTFYEIPFYEINPYLDRVIIFDKQNFRTILSFFRSLRERKYQLGIVPSTIKVSRTSHIINFLSGAKIKVGVKSIDGNKNNSHKFLNIKSDFNWENTHQLDRNLDVVRQIGCDLSPKEKEAIKFSFSDKEIIDAKSFLETPFTDKSKKIISFHPGAGKKENMWPTSNYIKLIRKIYEEYNNYVLLTYGKIDKDIINEVENGLKKYGVAYQLLDIIPIKQQGAILSLVDLYITNDTGSMHIAGFSDAKMISLFGPTDPNEWAPQGINKHFIKSITENINDISVDEVLNLSKKILEEEK
jgi:heptosyltransferase-2